VFRHQSDQVRDPNVTFEDRETAERASSGIDAEWAPPGEVVVGGVYLKLFLQNPHWSLRSPKRFLQELLTETLAALAKDSSEVSVNAQSCSKDQIIVIGE
jgi:hypothetical protein